MTVVGSTRESAIGWEAPRFLSWLIQSRSPIASIRLFRPTFFRPIQEEGGLTVAERTLLEEALKFRAQSGLSFWDSTLLLLSNQEIEGNSILRLAKRHNSQDSHPTIISRVDCTEGKLREHIATLPRGQILAISSKVSTDSGEPMHIPMLDFHCKESEGNVRLIAHALTELGLRGYIARTGGSYHFYGSQLIDEESLVTMLATALLYSPVVDHRWVAHQILERACGLRISPGKEYRYSPCIVAEV